MRQGFIETRTMGRQRLEMRVTIDGAKPVGEMTPSERDLLVGRIMAMMEAINGQIRAARKQDAAN